MPTFCGFSLPLAPEHGARLLLQAARNAGTLRSLYDPNQPRDEDGKWSGGGGTPDGVLAAIHQADGGFTYHAVSGTSPTTGYAVSVHKDREQIIESHDVTLVTLAQYAKTNRDLLSKTNNYMGGWHNPQDGRVYLDVSTVVGSHEEAQRLGASAGQLAYFDLEKGQSIEIPSHKAAAQFSWQQRAGADARRTYQARASTYWPRADGSGNYGSEARVLGGVGSGNFDHAGRPGEVGGSSNGFTRATAAQVKALGLPPAWTDVRVNPDPNGALVAVGIDIKGRTQYRYSAAHNEDAKAEKFGRVKEFGSTLPGLRSQIDKDFQTEEAAVILDLIDKTSFRIGSDRDTLAEVKAYGATTLEARHVKINGDQIDFKFVAKKGTLVKQRLVDARLAEELRPRVAEGGKLFASGGASKVRDYMKQHAPGFTPKDFRTWNATSAALTIVKKMKSPTTKKEFALMRKSVGETVGAMLGHTEKGGGGIALKSYISPVVFAKWEAGL